jgi:hypothetical protein
MNDLSVTVRGRFKRSVDLVRDFHSDASHITGYIVTPTARKVLQHMGASLKGNHPERAWTLTGPYGGGKSAFALFASHVVRGSKAALDHLCETDEALAEDFAPLQSSPFCPVLVGGARKPLNVALLEGLAEALDAFAEGRAVDGEEIHKGLNDLAGEARTAAGDANVSGEVTVELFEKASEVVYTATGGGLFVVVDELGKLLEYAALHPDRGDIFVLQQLAERAARTAEGEQAPLFLTTILHQAFERYASQLDRTQREEWQKVQGRFEDVAYVEPADATLQLLAEAIEREDDSVANDYGHLTSAVTEAAQLPTWVDTKEVEHLLRQALPLHPLVALMVGPLFRRLAQNERSLFAFLASGEPNGFLDVLRRKSGKADDQEMPLYRLDHLYDYLMTTLGATLFNQSTSKLWAETEAALGRMKEPTELSPVLLKQIALLNFAGEMAGLSATTDLLRASVDVSKDRVDEELDRLVDERVVVRRKYNDTYVVWQGSDIDIEEEIEKARSQVSPDVPLANLLRDVIPPRPEVANRHSYETGTTRVFEVVYAAGDTWRSALKDVSSKADGCIVYVLPERSDQREPLVDTLKSEAGDPMAFFAVPDGAETLHEVVYELKCLNWIHKNVEDLRGDKAARRELRERRADLEQRVDTLLNRLIVANEDGRNPCQWINGGATFRIASRRELQDRLSTACDEVFTNTPEIRNELLNLREPSPSAVRGQKKLLEAMVLGDEDAGRDPSKDRLGIDGTPAEYGLYASIVRATGMHRKGEDGDWYFTHPYEEERPGCYAVWKRIEQRFDEAKGKPVSIDTFFDLLTQRPYAVRQGLIPVFLFAYFKANRDEIAVYENGTFLKQIDYGTIERLLKSPAKFDMQQVSIAGVRQEVLQHLAPLVGLPEDQRKPLPIVLRLLRQVHGLPPFVRKTSQMSEEAMAVREALHRSTDPTALLFEELPEALNVGVDSFLSADDISEEEIQVFVRELQKAIREITGAYDQLIRSIQRRVASAFQVRANDVEEQRHEIAERAQALEPHVSDSDLKAFVIRATNEMMDTQAWYESIASLLASKPPVKWLDDDIDNFNAEVKRIARKFRNREPLVFEGNGEEQKAESERKAMRLHSIRLGITMLGEPEQETVVHIHPEDEEMAEDIANRLHDLLESDEVSKDKDKQVKLAALGKLIRRLKDEQETSIDAELDA